MASISSSSSLFHLNLPLQPRTPKLALPYLSFQPHHHRPTKPNFRLSYRFTPHDSDSDSFEEEEEEDDDSHHTFEEAVALFNTREYYKCHDYLEAIWNKTEEPKRTLIHGMLQCAVGFHHLFGRNHRGAMMELGEGLCKLRKMGFQNGEPFWVFEKEVSDVLEFVYQTQLELAACTEDLCLTMDGSERSYQLLGSYAAGKQLYNLENDIDGISYIVFCLEYDSSKPTRVKVPTLHATQEDLMACEYY